MGLQQLELTPFYFIFIFNDNHARYRLNTPLEVYSVANMLSLVPRIAIIIFLLTL